MTTIYRVEHPVSLIGPYNYDGDNREELMGMYDAHTSDSYHLSPYLDMSHPVLQHELCGFRTMRQLFTWFGGWLPVLIRNGFKVAVYHDVKVTAESSKQLVFVNPRVTP
jgi:hypothetical protein